MIFGLQYALVVSGYAATSFLLGNYMIKHTGAREIDLGFIFMIQPAVIVVRPFICSLADRYQSHKRLYQYFSLLSVLTHIPFIVVPFLKGSHTILDSNSSSNIEDDDDEGEPFAMGSKRTYFWLLVSCHFVSCICFCCMRTLGDVLTVNYCKRIGSTNTKYRKFGPISFGVCSLILGYVNINSTNNGPNSNDNGGGIIPTISLGLPDYVPGFILYTVSHLLLAILFYAWPDEFFVILSDSQLDTSRLQRLPSNKETWQHIKRKLNPFALCNRSTRSEASGWYLGYSKRDTRQKQADDDEEEDGTGRYRVNTRQQLSIFMLLMRRDFRIAVFLIVLIFCGIVGHSIQNFVYVYLHNFCKMDLKAADDVVARRNCNASTISGYIMAGICLTETLAYMLANRIGATKNKMAKIQLALLVLATHYLVLAYLVQHSAYYFLVESLHGLEFGLMIATSIESGDLFANEVELVIPELMRSNIVTKDDDLDLIRVSLVATMIACFLLVYDGLGGVIGSLMYGHIVTTYGYPAAFKVNACLTIGLFTAILCGTIFAKHYHLKPRLLTKTDDDRGDKVEARGRAQVLA